MNAGDYGVQFVLGTGFNMAGNTALSLVFTRPDATILTVTNPSVTISNNPYTPTTVPNQGTFANNTYFLYTFQNGDINQAGLYTVRGKYSASGTLLISNLTTFLVGP